MPKVPNMIKVRGHLYVKADELDNELDDAMGRHTLQTLRERVRDLQQGSRAITVITTTIYKELSSGGVDFIVLDKAINRLNIMSKVLDTAVENVNYSYKKIVENYTNIAENNRPV